MYRADTSGNAAEASVELTDIRVMRWARQSHCCYVFKKSFKRRYASSMYVNAYRQTSKRFMVVDGQVRGFTVVKRKTTFAVIFLNFGLVST